MKHFVRERICDCIKVEQELLESESLQEKIIDLAQVISKSLKNGGKIILCGNGGSASDAMHFAGEIVGRFQKERMAWPAIVLNADIATVTAIANDYGYDNVFARQMQGHAVSGDTFIGISTSGNTENVYRAVLEAKKAGLKTAALLGKDGGKIGEAVEYPLVIPCMITARIQESHILLIHILCELIENGMCT